MSRYFVRVGAFAEIHDAEGPAGLSAAHRVILRTSRGVEVGQIVGSIRQSETKRLSSASILRTTTEQDDLLLKRLERHKRRAVETCRASLRDSGSTATLLDVDQLFDGGTLVMHFLGPVDEIAQSITERIVEEYESVVRSRHFAKLLHDGCGPGCGSEAAMGCGGGGDASIRCEQCSLSRACPPRTERG